MAHSPEQPSGNPELPADEQRMAELLERLKITERIKNSLHALLADPENLYAQSDRAWAMRQLERIDGADHSLRNLLKHQFEEDLKNRRNTFPR